MRQPRTMTNPYTAVVHRWAHHPSFIYLGRFLVRPVDMLLRRLGRRPLSVIGTNLPVGYLTTVGRRTGELRTTPVVPVDSPAGVAVIASNWGQNRRPGWALNLTADPRCLMEREGSVRTCRARSASSAEREEIWQRALALYPAWASYDARVERDLEIFVLECVAGW